MPTIREMKPVEVQDASLLSRRVMKDSWERFEKDIYPREALEFDLTQHSPENYANSLKNQSHFNFVAEENKKLIGVTNGAVLGASGLARLGWIGVHPEYQRNGIGKALMHEVINHCRAEGCHKITLYTLPCLIPAVTLYLKVGFVPEAFLRKEWWSVDFLKMSVWLEP